jgi:hypothetical protein
LFADRTPRPATGPLPQGRLDGFPIGTSGALCEREAPEVHFDRRFSRW